MKNVALIMAAGKSTRCGFDKLVAQLGQQTVLEATLKTFQATSAVDEIWVIGKTVEANGKIKGSVKGGDSRFESVKAGLEHCAQYYDKNVRIIVHNAANPFLSSADLEAGLEQAQDKKNLIFGFFTPNAIKEVTESGIVNNFLDREQIFESQTPQISTLSTFIKALNKFGDRSQSAAQSEDGSLVEPKDEAELLAVTGEPIHIYECDAGNTKITFAADFSLPEGLKIGLGEDAHRFAPDFDTQKPFRLGGVDMSQGTLSSDGNSDGDLIFHALCNALLSAYGDTTFDPIAAPICAAGETNSKAYLEATLAHLNHKGHPPKIKQLLISLEGAQPKIAPQHDAIVKSIADRLSLKPTQIGLTYTTGEKLNEVGKGLGMRSFVLVTLLS